MSDLRFRHHLLTLVLIIVGAGSLIWLNISDRPGRYVQVGNGCSPFEDVQSSPKQSCFTYTYYKGWPIPYWEQYTVEGKAYGSPFFRFFSFLVIPVNIILCAGIFLLFATFCKRLFYGKAQRLDLPVTAAFLHDTTENAPLHKDTKKASDQC